MLHVCYLNSWKPFGLNFYRQSLLYGSREKEDFDKDYSWFTQDFPLKLEIFNPKDWLLPSSVTDVERHTAGCIYIVPGVYCSSSAVLVNSRFESMSVIEYDS